MKINHSVALIIAVVTSFSPYAFTTNYPQSSLYNPDVARDYFSSPALIAQTVSMTPLSSFFDTAKEKVAPTHTDFFSHAFSAFIQSTYNGAGYADVLSRDSRHITEFLQLSNDYHLNAEQVYTGLRLFLNKLKETIMVDDTVTNHVLNVLPHELERHFPLKPLQSLKQKSPTKMVENIMLTEFTDHLLKPRTSTENFFKDLSVTITQSIKNAGGINDDAAMKERLRGIVFRLVDLLLSKTMWYPQHPESIWPSVLQAAHSISLLCSSSIINHLDDVCELHKTLISRFISFIEQSGNQLSAAWYTAIEADLTQGLVPFLETPELDAGITSKKELLLNALAQGKTCAIAQQEHGLIIN